MKLAVFFPGIGYNHDRPLLYYSKKLAVKYGYETLPVAYRDLPPDAKSSREKTAECTRLAMEQAERIVRETDLSRYSDILFAGKSIGTIISAKLAKESGCPEKIRQILYTPLMETFDFDIPDGIVFTGGNDPWVGGKDSRISMVCKEKGIPYLFVPDANHSLETGDPVTDVENLARIMRETERFIQRAK